MSTAAPKTRDVLACPECGATYPLGTRFCKIDGAALDRAAGDPRAGGDPLIGKVIGGRYLIHKKLGEGGMGAVYAAEHTIMRRPVALKLVRDELAHDATVATRFVREARVATRLTAPEIVQVFDSGATEEGRLFLAMELLTGETLRERLARGALPEQEALRIGSAILRALVVAHGAGVVHRDLKPDNVFLCAGGQVKVLDFGIARVLGGDDEPSSVSVTATGAIVGTALYVSPEAVSRVKVGPAADLYSFGAILFEMLAGAPPFYDEHPVLLMGMHLRVPPPRLSDKAQRIFPSALEEIV
ncbi:MAG: serine/threonine protein kinase, partial [Sandaracinaceae bacterium]|nr:serine/threonine protein kinase [Sandaracinaceae bacterium]